MLFVIIGHLKTFSDVNVYGINFLWNGFYMQAFFFITGYCSSYKKDWGTFIKDNVKGILVPLVCISFLITFLKLCRGTYTDWEYRLSNINLDYWFLLAIFLARIAYRSFANSGVFLRIALAVVSYFLGFVLWKYEILPNVWYFKQALMLLPFLICGDLLKKLKFDAKSGISAALIYALALLSIKLCGFQNSIIAYDIHLDWNNLLQGIVIALSGSIALIYFCKLIKRCRLLEYFGKNSLVLFMCHFMLLNTSIRIFNRFAHAHNFLTFIAIFSTTVLLSIVFIYIINLKWFKWMTGKF